MVVNSVAVASILGLEKVKKWIPARLQSARLRNAIAEDQPLAHSVRGGSRVSKLVLKGNVRCGEGEVLSHKVRDLSKKKLKEIGRKERYNRLYGIIWGHSP
jgi:hypothetical protein